MEKRNLYIMCGVPGSGKSTWLKNHECFFDPSHAVISRDAIRFGVIKEGDEYFSKENEVWVEFVRQAKESLTNNVDTILDATHLNVASRTKILRELKDSLKGVHINAIVINTSLNTCLDQNEQREGLAKVPRGAVRRMYYSFEVPEFEEGFDQIYVIGNEEEVN